MISEAQFLQASITVGVIQKHGVFFVTPRGTPKALMKAFTFITRLRMSVGNLINPYMHNT